MYSLSYRRVVAPLHLEGRSYLSPGGVVVASIHAVLGRKYCMGKSVVGESSGRTTPQGCT